MKTHAPQQLTQWRHDNEDHNHSYADLPQPVYQSLKKKLLEEQGELCAYTGRLIGTTSSHLEHLKPQCECNEWEDVEYRNVVACFPADGGEKSHGYGAPVKDNWWNSALFVSPLSADCEHRFRFVWSGHIHPSPSNHLAAIETTKVIGLDNEELRKLRKKRIDGFFGFGMRTRSWPLSIADAKIALAYIDQFDGNGRLQEFCFVLKQLLPKYIAQGGGNETHQ